MTFFIYSLKLYELDWIGLDRWTNSTNRHTTNKNNQNQLRDHMKSEVLINYSYKYVCISMYTCSGRPANNSTSQSARQTDWLIDDNTVSGWLNNVARFSFIVNIFHSMKYVNMYICTYCVYNQAQKYWCNIHTF